MKRIEITWIDAEQDTEWEDQDNIDEPKTKFVTRGFLLKKDDNYVYVATTLGVEGNKDCSTFRIPHGCIEEMKSL